MLVTHGDEILYRAETYTEPFTWWKYDTNKDRNRADATELRGTSPVAFSDVETIRVKAISKDGTEVPMTIIYQKGARTNGESERSQQPTKGSRERFHAGKEYRE